MSQAEGRREDSIGDAGNAPRAGWLLTNASAVNVLLALAVFYTLYFASPVIIPVVLATLLAFALAPIVRLFERALIPRAVAAALVVFGLVAALIFGLVSLSEPASAWISEAPNKLRSLEPRLEALKEPIDVLREASEGVESLTEIEDNAQDGALVVEIQQRSFLDAALSGTPRMAASFVAAVFFLYFLLAAGDRIASKIQHVFPHLLMQRDIREVGLRVEQEISRYLLTISMINLALGALTSGWLWYNGIENALLWGIAVAVFNFAPYIGSVASLVLLTVVSLLQFEIDANVVVVVLGYLALTIVEGQLVTPLLVGRRLLISPYIIFLTIILLGWMWGLVGVLIAVPLLVCLKIVGEQWPRAKFLAALIALEPESEDASAAASEGSDGKSRGATL